VNQPALFETAQTPAKPAPARAVHVPGKRPPDMPETLSAAARSILAALSKVGKPANKAELLAAGADRATWSEGLSELYRARKVKRAPGAEVAHQIA
jgi:hypothetical protein